MEYGENGTNLQVAVYFMNTIGEAYSKIIQDTSIKNKYIKKEDNSPKQQQQCYHSWLQS